MADSEILTKLRTLLSKFAKNSDLAAVAKSGSYNDLADKPEKVASTWTDVDEKPFETVGDGLTVNSDKSVSIDETILDEAIAQVDNGGTDQTSFDSFVEETAEKFSAERTYADTTKVAKSDALTLEEIEASTDLSGKVPLASAVKDIVKHTLGTPISLDSYTSSTNYFMAPCDGYVECDADGVVNSYAVIRHLSGRVLALARNYTADISTYQSIFVRKGFCVYVEKNTYGSTRFYPIV